MNHRIDTRIRRLKTMIPSPLVVICKLPTGEEACLTVDECIAVGADPVRTQGGNLKDAYKLLAYMAGPNCVID